MYHFLACDLYSDAQTNFADDLALSSLETAYIEYIRNRNAFGPGFDTVRAALEQKLRVYHQYYQTWSRPFAYVDANPCADHLYTYLSELWLAAAAREQDPTLDVRDAEVLSRLIRECSDDAHAFYRVLARRFLGLRHGADGRSDLAATQYAAALEDARRLKLDTEIGHLRRLLGAALRDMGNAKEARHHFEQSYAYEKLESACMFTSYWQALSACELGDTLIHLAGRRADTLPMSSPDVAVIIDDPEATLRPALAAYHDGRMFLNSHMSLQCPFPVARAAKQQLFRSFSDNALHVACMLQSAKEMLAGVEWSGPREVTELATEMAAAREMAPASLHEFRLNRAKYYATLNTLPARFEDYLTNVVEYWNMRRAYLEQCFALDNKLIMTQWSDKIAEQIHALRLPDIVFLLFHVGQRESMMVMADMSSSAAEPFPLPAGEPHLRAIHDEYVQAVMKEPGKRDGALDLLLARYAELLGPVLEPVLRFLPGKHLKIFPRLQMNAVPLHALRLQGKYLIEHCATISYGQTLGLFLENHRTPPVAHAATVRMVIGDRVPWYQLLLPKVRMLYGDQCVEEHQPTWNDLMNALASKPANDTVFACHGTYQPNDLEASRLVLASDSSDGAVRFARVFAELDLHGCRSVMMGACESGLVRAEIGAEYLGLASAMLSSGVRYVLGALWTIPQVATAAVVLCYLELIKSPSANVPAALCEAQRQVMGMTRDACAAWIRELVPPGPNLDTVLQELAAKEEQHPFAHPYHWAGLHVVGDV